MTGNPEVINDEGWNGGDYVTQVQLAATLSFVRDSGRDGFYKGIVAGQIINEMERGGGLITREGSGILRSYLAYTFGRHL